MTRIKTILIQQQTKSNWIDQSSPLISQPEIILLPKEQRKMTLSGIYWLSYLDEATKRSVCDSKMVPHKKTVSCVTDFDSHSTQVKQRMHSSSPHPAQEKGRISNVVAKLMGLEELPQKDNPTCAQKESSIKSKEINEKDRKVSSRNPKLPAPFNGDCKNRAVLRTDKTSQLTNNSVQTRDMKFDLKAEKCQEIPDENSKLKTSVRYQKTSKTLTVGSDAVSALLIFFLESMLFLSLNEGQDLRKT